MDYVSIVNGTSLPIHNSGQGILPLPDSNRKLRLQNLLHIPSLSHNQLSISKLVFYNNCCIYFDAGGFAIKDLLDNWTLICGRSRDSIYPIRTNSDPPVCALHTKADATYLWHSHLGHPHHKLMTILSKSFPFICINSFSLLCNSCRVAKSHELSFPKHTTNVTQPFSLIHSAVWNPSNSSLYGFKYYIIFIDDNTRFCWLHLMHSKDEAFTNFSNLPKWLKQTSTHKSKPSTPTEVENTPTQFSNNFYLIMALHMNWAVPTLLNKMTYPRGNTIIYMTPLVPYSM